MAGRSPKDIASAIASIAQSTLPYLEDYKISVKESKDNNIFVKEIYDSRTGMLAIIVQVPTAGAVGELVESPMFISELINYSRDEHDEADIYLFLDAIQEDIALSGGLAAPTKTPTATPMKKKRTAKREAIGTIREKTKEADQWLLSTILDTLVSRVEYSVTQVRSLKVSYDIAQDLQTATEGVLDSRGDRSSLEKLRASLKRAISTLFKASTAKDKNRLKSVADIFIDDCCDSSEKYFDFENDLVDFNAALEEILNYIVTEKPTLL